MGCIKSKQGLSQEDLEFLKTHTRYDENTIKEWYKGFKQDCPNGRLTPPKFVDMYKLFFPSGNAEQFCDHVFRTFDTDKNGFIDFREFLLAIDVTSAGTPEEKLKWAFRSAYNNYLSLPPSHPLVSYTSSLSSSLLPLLLLSPPFSLLIPVLVDRPLL